MEINTCVYIFLFIFSHKSGLGNKRDVHVANWKRKKKKSTSTLTPTHTNIKDILKMSVQSTKNCTQNIKQNYQCICYTIYIIFIMTVEKREQNEDYVQGWIICTKTKRHDSVNLCLITQEETKSQFSRKNLQALSTFCCLELVQENLDCQHEKHKQLIPNMRKPAINKLGVWLETTDNDDGSTAHKPRSRQSLQFCSTHADFRISKSMQ